MNEQTAAVQSGGMGVKEAVAAAFAFVQDLYSEKLADLTLEEVEKDFGHWNVTVSFSVPENSPNPIRALGMSTRRLYKILKVDAQTGEIESMKIRPVEPAL